MQLMPPGSAFSKALGHGGGPRSASMPAKVGTWPNLTGSMYSRLSTLTITRRRPSGISPGRMPCQSPECGTRRMSRPLLRAEAPGHGPDREARRHVQPDAFRQGQANRQAPGVAETALWAAADRCRRPQERRAPRAEMSAKTENVAVSVQTRFHMEPARPGPEHRVPRARAIGIGKFKRARCYRVVRSGTTSPALEPSQNAPQASINRRRLSNRSPRL
jgi:hypothetical protein